MDQNPEGNYPSPYGGNSGSGSGAYPPPQWNTSPGQYAVPSGPAYYPPPPGAAYPPYGWPESPYSPASGATSPTRRVTARRIALIGSLTALAVIAVVSSLLVFAWNARHAPVNHFTDPLTSDTHGWTSSGDCSFFGSAYHVNPAPLEGAVVCFSPTGSFANFDMHVTCESFGGPNNYGYGLAFRHVSRGDFYVFVMDGKDHAWFIRYTNGEGQRISAIWQVPPVVQGARMRDTLQVVARGALLTGVVDGTALGTVTDTTYATGTVGVYSGAPGLNIAFTDFEITRLP